MMASHFNCVKLKTKTQNVLFANSEMNVEGRYNPGAAISCLQEHIHAAKTPESRIKEQTGGSLLPGVFLRLTFAAALHLPDLVEGVGQQVGQPAVQVNRSQAALVSFPRCDQPGQAAVHALPYAAHVQLTCSVLRANIRKSVSQ